MRGRRRAGCVEFLHGCFGEVTAVPGFPLVVLLDEDRSGQPEKGCRVGEDPDNVGASFDLLVHLLHRVRGPDLTPMLRWEPAESENVFTGIVEHRGDLRVGLPSMRATSSNWVCTCPASGWANTVRMIEATISWAPLGTVESTLRMKCRQRCHDAPWKTVLIAYFSPVWASEMTSLTPPRPRVLSERRKSVQDASFSLSPTSNASTSRRPSAATPNATTIAWDTTR